MMRISRSVGILYIALYLHWVYWVSRELGQWNMPVDYWARWLATPLVLLLLSHWFVKRGRFRAAVFPLVLWWFLPMFPGFQIAICGTCHGPM
jgi:hypothetical protein